MYINRYVPVLSIKCADGSLIPIWDDRVTRHKDKDYSNYLQIDNDLSHKYFDLEECLFDLKTKKLKPTIILEYYPTDKDLDFHIGDEILYEDSRERSYHVLCQSKIKNIIFESFISEICKGSNLTTAYKERFPNINFEDNDIYHYKTYEPWYVLENDDIIKYGYKLYHLKKNSE